MCPYFFYQKSAEKNDVTQLYVLITSVLFSSIHIFIPTRQTPDSPQTTRRGACLRLSTGLKRTGR